MAQIYVPIISPFSVTGPLHEADDSHIQSHHIAYEIASLSRSLEALLAQYEAMIEEVAALQSKNELSNSNCLSNQLKKAEKALLNSMLPHQIRTVRARIHSLNHDLILMTNR